MKRIILKPGEEQRILAGHPWVYDNEVDQILEGKGSARAVGPASGPGPHTAVLEPGECADVESSPVWGKPLYLGRAFANPNSKIIARIYSPSKEGIDKGFFKRRIREAWERRFGGSGLVPVAPAAPAVSVASTGAAFAYNPSRDSCRIVFGEADFLPGLIIDRFTGWPLAELEASCAVRPLAFEAVEAVLGPPRSWLVVQLLAYGMDCRREMILEALEELMSGAEPAGIIEKSGARVRELEGLPLTEGLICGSFPPGGIVIFENGLPFAVDLIGGQKTGHFLDQRDNRRLAGRYAAMLCADADKAVPLRVLDAFAYTGGFGFNILRAAEAELIAVDSSAAALETLRKNAALNGAADRVNTVDADVFETLRSYERKKEQFDMVILDPPAFAKARTMVTEALRGYKEINLRAMKLVRAGGILVSCSCSHALDESRFRRMITEAAADAERRLVQLDFRSQGPDHPVLVGYEESLYLKCGFYRVL
jgi:23S rRNA (cytosine1962-C5)-methyltransferase